MNRLWLTLLALLNSCSQRSFDPGQLSRDFPAQSQAPRWMRFLDDRHLWVHVDGQVAEDRVWDPLSGALLSKYSGMDECALPNADFTQVAVGHGEVLRVLSLPDKTELASYEGRACPDALLDDGTLLASGRDAERRTRLTAYRDKVTTWSHTFTGTSWFDLRDERIAFADEGALTVVDFRLGVTLWSTSAKAGTVKFSPDGAAVRAGSRLFDAATGESLGEISGHGSISWFSKTDAILYDSSGALRRVGLDGTVKWELPLLDDKRHRRPLFAHAVSDDGTFVVMQVENVKSIVLVDAMRGQKLMLLARRDDYPQFTKIESMVISPDLMNVVVAQSGTLVVWPTTGSRKFRALVDPALKR
ncbi:MAG: hypothetical protein ACO1OB_22930 [Archangium sp.]